jgi:hypothetical protein
MNKNPPNLPTFIIRQSSSHPILMLIMGFVAFLSVFSPGYILDRQGAPPPIKFSDTGPTIEQIQRLNQLESSKVMIAGVLTGEDDGYRGAWLIKGDALIGVDLSKAVLSDVNPEKRTAILTLPNPIVISARVDHERTKTWDMKSISWIPWNGDSKALQDRSMVHAQKLIEFAGSKSDVIEGAKKSSKQSLAGFYKSVNWDVTIKWK